MTLLLVIMSAVRSNGATVRKPYNGILHSTLVVEDAEFAVPFEFSGYHLYHVFCGETLLYSSLC
jgi:hypothetical protein